MASRPLSWIFDATPIWYRWASGRTASSGMIAIGNPLLLWGSIVALVASLWARGAAARPRRPRRPRWSPCLYLPWLATSRQTYIYYLTPAIPFLAILVAAALARLAGRGAARAAGRRRRCRGAAARGPRAGGRRRCAVRWRWPSRQRRSRGRGRAPAAEAALAEAPLWGATPRGRQRGRHARGRPAPRRAPAAASRRRRRRSPPGCTSARSSGWPWPGCRSSSRSRPVRLLRAPRLVHGLALETALDAALDRADRAGRARARPTPAVPQPISAAMTAFWACRRFSAWSKTTDCGL